MKQMLAHIALLAALFCGTLAPATLAAPDSHAHRNAVKICKRNYRDKVRALNRLKGRDTRARVAEAKRELRECIDKAPR